ncbi:MAG: hypothetical protein Q9210_005602 [Variospora velana]
MPTFWDIESSRFLCPVKRLWWLQGLVGICNFEPLSLGGKGAFGSRRREMQAKKFPLPFTSPTRKEPTARMLSILRKARLKDKEMRILMLGLDNAGKTTIVKRLMNEDVNTASSSGPSITKGKSFRRDMAALYTAYSSLMGSSQIQAQHLYDLHVIGLANLLIGDGDPGDVGGQKTLRTYWRNYFEKTDALIWVVDAADRFRVHDCRKELAGLLLEEACRLMGASLLVFANKTDIEGSMSDNEIRELLALDAIKTHQWAIMQCSAITGSNLQQGIRWVVEDAKEKLFLY